METQISTINEGAAYIEKEVSMQSPFKLGHLHSQLHRLLLSLPVIKTKDLPSNKLMHYQVNYPCLPFSRNKTIGNTLSYSQLAL